MDKANAVVIKGEPKVAFWNTEARLNPNAPDMSSKDKREDFRMAMEGEVSAVRRLIKSFVFQTEFRNALLKTLFFDDLEHGLRREKPMLPS